MRLALSLRPHPEVRDWTMTHERVLWLIAALALVLVPHLARVPVWVSAIFALLALWRLGTAVRGLDLPPRWLRVALCVVLLSGIWVSYGTVTGRAPGVAMLAALAGLKLVESHTLRDAYVLVFLGFFLVITNFLFSQSIWTGAYMLAVVLVLIGALSAIATTGRLLDVRARLRLCATILVQAIPIMLVLFVLFPRIPGPLWGLPKDAHSGVSGLSESMTPGNISQLSLSDEVAFRVRFDRDRPPASQLYWRGPVLRHTDGRTWRSGDPARSPKPVPFERLGPPVDYVVTLEPHRHRWLFALDLPATIPQKAQMTSGYQLRAPKRVRERARYRVRSYTEYRADRITRGSRQVALEIPRGAHPRARALALAWRSRVAEDTALVERALAWFRARPFVYTLTPKPLSGDAVDQFLFETREGFCENYASAFTVLMRAAGVPARVVTGYQGGEYNPMGDYVVVRQRDAHAWVEVWLESRGWTRIDPTGTVAPERIERGVDAAIPPTIGPRGLDIRAGGQVLEAWRRMRNAWDAANAAWNEWVLGYGPMRQRLLLARFGVDARNFALLAVAIVGLVAAVMGAVALGLGRRTAHRDRALRAWRRFQRRLARQGVPVRPSEGPRDYARRAAAARPEREPEVRAIADRYVAVRYGDRGDVRALERAVREFR